MTVYIDALCMPLSWTLLKYLIICMHLLLWFLFSCLCVSVFVYFLFFQKISSESPTNPGSPGATSTSGENAGYRLHSNPSQVMQDRRLPWLLRLPRLPGEKTVVYTFLSRQYDIKLSSFICVGTYKIYSATR